MPTQLPRLPTLILKSTWTLAVSRSAILCWGCVMISNLASHPVLAIVPHHCQATLGLFYQFLSWLAVQQCHYPPCQWCVLNLCTPTSKVCCKTLQLLAHGWRKCCMKFVRAKVKIFAITPVTHQQMLPCGNYAISTSLCFAGLSATTKSDCSLNVSCVGCGLYRSPGQGKA